MEIREIDTLRFAITETNVNLIAFGIEINLNPYKRASYSTISFWVKTSLPETTLSR
jgi:hypothetical protein